MHKFQRDMQYRDVNWLYTGKLPEPTFLNKEAFEQKRHDFRKIENYYKSDEYKNIERLCAHGYSGQIRRDAYHLKDGRTISYADLANGLEVKQFKNGHPKNISKAFTRSAKKLEMSGLYIDASQNQLILDDAIFRARLAESAKAKGFSDVVFLWPNGEIERLFY